ncbi:pilus assembly PilX N-terminal domain-containing protein, partial [Candidatus Aerophobetes bacterium]|nr:pilus assembly PilX N-terminal domain-containing protein [Candidatus Aerophobetes bacterium]
MQRDWSKEKGIILPLVLIFALLLMISGLAFMSLGIQEASLVQREISKRQAFYLAEAGLERALYDLRQDFEKGTQNWADGEINEVEIDSKVNEGGFSSLLYNGTFLGSGSYSVAVKNISIDLEGLDKQADEFIKDEIWVKVRGTFEDISKTIQAYVTIENLSPWNNAIFCGERIKEKIDSANIHGSVHLLGKKGMKETLFLAESTHIYNNYHSIFDELKQKIPPCPKVVFNEEIVESLKAKLRVKQGGVFLDFDAGIGTSPSHSKSKLEAFKPTVDGVYTALGFMGEGEDNVYSDNGKETSYNLGQRVKFPSLYDSYIDPATRKKYSYTYWDYLKENSLHIKENEITYQTSVFSYSHPEKGSISWDGQGGLKIEGIIYVNGDLVLGKEDQPAGTQTIRYEGKGILVCNKSIFIHSHLFP